MLGRPCRGEATHQLPLGIESDAEILFGTENSAIPWRFLSGPETARLVRKDTMPVPAQVLDIVKRASFGRASAEGAPVKLVV